MPVFDEYAMIIGAMKCGTSSLFHFLGQHPQICPSTPKEPEFFSDQYGGHRPATYDELWDFDPSRHTIKLEASTGYTKWPVQQRVPEKIRDAGLSPRFIYIVRDPIARIQSQWKHQRRIRTQGQSVPSGVPFDGYREAELLDLSKYDAQLARFRSVFPEKERYLILEFEQLNDPQAISSKCFEFLGVDPGCRVDDTAPQNTAPPMAELEARMFFSGMATKGRFLPAPAKRAIRSLLRKLSPNRPTQLTASQRAEIWQMLREDLENFGRNYGLDVGKWE